MDSVLSFILSNILPILEEKLMEHEPDIQKELLDDIISLMNKVIDYIEIKLQSLDILEK